MYSKNIKVSWKRYLKLYVELRSSLQPPDFDTTETEPVFGMALSTSLPMLEQSLT